MTTAVADVEDEEIDNCLYKSKIQFLTAYQTDISYANFILASKARTDFSMK